MPPKARNTSTTITDADQSGKGSGRKGKGRKPSQRGRKASKGKGKQRGVYAIPPSMHLEGLTRSPIAVEDPSENDDGSSPEDAPEPHAAAPTPAAATQNALLPRQVKQSAREVEENDKVIKQLAGIDKAEDAKQKAIYSYNVIDITNPPLPLNNQYNPCPLNPMKVVSMRNTLISEGFRVFAHDNRIMIVISPSDVDPTCITLDLHTDPKPLVLKSVCALKQLPIIGGQHR